MSHEIRNQPFKKRVVKFLLKYGSIIGTVALIPVIAISFVVVHQKQDIRQHASGPIDNLLYPPEEPELAAKNVKGLLRVRVMPSTSTTITVTQNGKVVLKKQSEIDGELLNAGDYSVNFSKSGNTAPPTTSFSIKGGSATEIVADFNTGKATVNTK